MKTRRSSQAVGDQKPEAENAPKNEPENEPENEPAGCAGAPFGGISSRIRGVDVPKGDARLILWKWFSGSSEKAHAPLPVVLSGLRARARWLSSSSLTECTNM